MDLYLLAELKTISLKVTTVDMQKPPPDFRYVTSQILMWENYSVLFKMVVVHICHNWRHKSGIVLYH
jgi:hypothetical protein